MDKLDKIETELNAQSFFAWYVLGIAIMISGASMFFSGAKFEGLVIIFLGIGIWVVASILGNKARKR